MREGSYTTQVNGKTVTVDYTDGDVLRDVADLYAVVQGEYRGTPSMESHALKTMLGELLAGAPLSGAEWEELRRLTTRYGQALEDFRASPDNETQGFVPLPDVGTGRIAESALLRMVEQYATPSTTTKDKATTPPHLLDSVLHDLGHSSQHVKRLLDADVRGNKQSHTFNVEHAINHLDSAVEHAKKLDAHLSQHPADPKTWTAEREKLNEHRAMSETAGPYVEIALSGLAPMREYSDDEPRDDHGRWGSGAGGPDPLTGPRWVPDGTRIQMPGQIFGSKVVGRSTDGYLVRHEPGLPGTGPLSNVHDTSAVAVHAAALDSGYRPGREASTPREDSGKFMRGSRTYDPLLLNADGGHAAEAAQRLLDEGRIRVAGQSDATQQAVDDLTRRVGSKATVKTMAVQGNPSIQMKATREATTWPQRLAIVREASDKIATEQVAADPASPLLHKPRIAVDFDGVIHMGGHGMPGEVEGLPVPGVQAALKELAKRYDVIVLTARQDFAAVRKWLKANGMNDSISQVTNVKPEALAYIDDRAVHFAGDWKAAVAAVDPARPVSQPIQLKKAFEAASPIHLLPPSGLRLLCEYSD